MTAETQDAPEKLAAIRTIRKLMDFWRIEPDELPDLPAPPPPPPRTVEAPVVRYRHPHTGDTWDGQGRQPEWLRTALLREGFTVEELRAAVRAADDRSSDDDI